ncbi:hypothetical protein N2152v2_011138 [Parachlorella kessleri]
MAITAMPMLSRLDVTLPTPAFAVIGRVLPRSLHLTSLTVFFRGASNSELVEVEVEEEEEEEGKAFRRALRCLPFLQELTITRIPIDAELGFDLMKAARCLSRGLTSLDLSFCSPNGGHNPAAAALQGDSLHQLDQLASLTRLQRLQLNGLLGGQQHVPPALGTLTSLDLQGQDPMVLRGISSLVVLRDLRLQELSEWPSGLGSLRWLTRLELRAGRALALPTGCALPPQLRHLEVNTDMETDSCPIVLPSLSTLGQLQHLQLEECDLDELLDSLPHLSCLTLLRLRFCRLEGDLGGEGSRLQLSHLAALQHLQVESCTLSEAPAGLRQLSALTELVLDSNDIGLGCYYCSDDSDDDDAMDEGDRPATAGLLGAMYDGFMSDRALDEDDRIWLGPTSPLATLSRLPALQRLSLLRQSPYSGHCHHRHGSKSARRLVQQQLHTFLSMPSPTLANITYLQLSYDSGSSEQLPWKGLEDGSMATSRQPLPLPDKLRTACPQLSHLACRFVDGPALVRVLPHLAGLTELDVRHCDLSGAPLDLGRLRSLQRASFQLCRISQPPVGLSTLGALTKLELQGNALSFGSERVVRGQAGCHVDVEF